MDQTIYEAAKATLEAELAESTDERERQRLENAIADITRTYEASSNA